MKREAKKEKLRFLFSLLLFPGVQHRDSVQDVLCSCSLQPRSADPMGILLQVGAPSTTAEGLRGVRTLVNHP